MLSVGTVVIGVHDLHRAVAFWTQAFVSETAIQPYPRIHLDLYSGDAADQAAEVERLISLRAKQVDWDRYPENPDFVVLSDTEDNRFCVIDTSR